MSRNGDSLSPEDRAVRNQMKDAIKKRRDCDDAEAEVILHRIADRLGGYTHEEAAERNPLPEREN